MEVISFADFTHTQREGIIQNMYNTAQKSKGSTQNSTDNVILNVSLFCLTISFVIFFLYPSFFLKSFS